jgi:hypothetical protein
LRSPALDAAARAPAAALAVDEDPDGGRLVVRAAFAVEAAEAHLPARTERLRDADGAEHPVAAVVPVALVLLPLDGVPWARQWAVPIYGAPARPGARLAGHLALQALETGERLPPGRYAAWLAAGGRLHGPAVFEKKR